MIKSYTQTVKKILGAYKTTPLPLDSIENNVYIPKVHNYKLTTKLWYEAISLRRSYITETGTSLLSTVKKHNAVLNKLVWFTIMDIPSCIDLGQM